MNFEITLLYLFAWSYMIIGPVSGIYMSRWAYKGATKVPDGFDDYTSERRRIYRVAHINGFVFPYMCIMWGLTVQQSQLSDSMITVGAILMATSTVFMTLPLFLSLKWPKLRNVSALGAVSLVGGIGVISWGLLQSILMH